MSCFIVAMMNGVPESYIGSFAEAFFSGFVRMPAENYAITFRNDLLTYKGNLSGDTWRKFVFLRGCSRINQYYLAATGQKEPKRIRDNYNPYDIFDANGKIVYRKGKYVGDS